MQVMEELEEPAAALLVEVVEVVVLQDHLWALEEMVVVEEIVAVLVFPSVEEVVEEVEDLEVQVLLVFLLVLVVMGD
jgi:hypothetical protein